MIFVEFEVSFFLSLPKNFWHNDTRRYLGRRFFFAESCHFYGIFMKRSLFLLALLFFSSTTLAQTAPTMTVNHDSQKSVDFQLVNPQGHHTTDWGTLKLYLNQFNITDTIIALLGTPIVPFGFHSQGQGLNISILAGFPGLKFAGEFCTLGLNSECADSYRVLRDATCGGDEKCLNTSSLWLNADSAGASQKIYAVSAVPFSTKETVFITGFHGIGGTAGDVMTNHWAAHSPRFNLFKGTSTTTVKEEFDQSPVYGNVYRDVPLTITHHEDFPNSSNFKLHRVSYRAMTPIVVPPGNYFLVVHHLIGSGGGGTSWHWKESRNIPNSDYVKTVTMPVSQPYTSFALNPGAISLDIIGY
jgi:hypothetical protein